MHQEEQNYFSDEDEDDLEDADEYDDFSDYFADGLVHPRCDRDVIGHTSDRSFGDIHRRQRSVSEGNSALLEAGEDNRRDHHNQLERKRRASIKTSYNDLREAIPSLRGSKASRAVILQRAVECIEELVRLNREHTHCVETLKRQNDLLDSRVQELQRLVQRAEDEECSNTVCSNHPASTGSYSIHAVSSRPIPIVSSAFIPISTHQLHCASTLTISNCSTAQSVIDKSALSLPTVASTITYPVSIQSVSTSEAHINGLPRTNSGSILRAETTGPSNDSTGSTVADDTHSGFSVSFSTGSSSDHIPSGSQRSSPDGTSSSSQMSNQASANINLDDDNVPTAAPIAIRQVDNVNLKSNIVQVRSGQVRCASPFLLLNSTNKTIPPSNLRYIIEQNPKELESSGRFGRLKRRKQDQLP